MSEVKNIDIEAIMQEIRKDAQAHPYAADAVYEKTSTAAASTGGVDYLGRLENAVGNAQGNANILAERPTGGGLGGLLKKIIRKLCRFFVVPIVHDQNVFNNNVAVALNAAYNALAKKDECEDDSADEDIYLLKLAVNRDMAKRLDALEAENKRLAQEVAALKKQVTK